jgi:hypothetical protein
MKSKDIIIAILVIVIIAQFIQSFFLLKKLNQKEFIERPAEIYIADLTQRLREVRITGVKVIRQATWFRRHLGKCIEALENKEGLKPIPIESPELIAYLKIKGFPSPDQNESMKRLQAEPFFEPYEEPNSPPLEDLKERPVQYALCSLNLDLWLLRNTQKNFDGRIQNYEQRLKRLNSFESGKE